MNIIDKQIEDLKIKIKDKINAYGQAKFAKDYGLDISDVNNFIHNRREYSFKKLLYIDNFFSKKQ
jgi:hypothetical protein